MVFSKKQVQFNLTKTSHISTSKTSKEVTRTDGTRISLQHSRLEAIRKIFLGVGNSIEMRERKPDDGESQVGSKLAELRRHKRKLRASDTGPKKTIPTKAVSELIVCYEAFDWDFFRISDVFYWKYMKEPRLDMASLLFAIYRELKITNHSLYKAWSNSNLTERYHIHKEMHEWKIKGVETSLHLMGPKIDKHRLGQDGQHDAWEAPENCEGCKEDYFKPVYVKNSMGLGGHD